MSDKAYREWIKGRPCIVCGLPGEPCHVRLNGRGGMATKPKYSAVALCHDHHMQQHQKGHLSLFSKEDWLFYAGESLRNWLLESEAK